MMKKHADIIRPFLFSVRLLLWFCAVITMALTAWVVDHLKGYRAIFPLVIVSIRIFLVTWMKLTLLAQAVLTTAFYIPSIFTAGMRRNRGYMIPLDIVFYALYIRPFSLIPPTIVDKVTTLLEYMKLIIPKTIDGYQHSFLLPKLMTWVMEPGVLTTIGTEVRVAGGGMPSKHLLSYLCELSPPPAPRPRRAFPF
jgi:hypothetical protein